jgi:hypothetical protein
MNSFSSAIIQIKSITQTNHHTAKMKTNKYIAGFLALLAVQSASALTVEITGATAFRRATIEAVVKYYNDAPGDPVFRYVANNVTLTSADFITFEGVVGGVNTIIRCSFNGSIEGLRALAEPGQSGATSNGDAYYFKTSALTATATSSGAGSVIAASVGNPALTPELERAEAEMAFSDTTVAISPYFRANLIGKSPGACVFAVCSTDGSGITNVTSQQYNSLLKSGYVPKSFFTGVEADTSLVFATGRNDGSGTRSSYLAEMGYGVANAVTQYLVLSRSSTNTATGTITAIQAVPAGGVNNPLSPDLLAWQNAGNTLIQDPKSASIVWGQNINGNGGAASGSALTLALAQRGPSVKVFDANGEDVFGDPVQDIAMVTWISLNDAVVARTGGANICAFNGVSLALDGASNTMSTSDRNKVLYGAYSAWNYQQFYYKAGAAPAVVALHTSLNTLIENGALGVAGLKNSDFKIGRSQDGGTINTIE